MRVAPGRLRLLRRRRPEDRPDALTGRRLDIEPGGGGCPVIDVHDAHAHSPSGKFGGEADGEGRLAHPALLGRQSRRIQMQACSVASAIANAQASVHQSMTSGTTACEQAIHHACYQAPANACTLYIKHAQRLGGCRVWHAVRTGPVSASTSAVREEWASDEAYSGIRWAPRSVRGSRRLHCPSSVISSSQVTSQQMWSRMVVPVFLCAAHGPCDGSVDAGDLTRYREVDVLQGRGDVHSVGMQWATAVQVWLVGPGLGGRSWCVHRGTACHCVVLLRRGRGGRDGRVGELSGEDSECAVFLVVSEQDDFGR